MQRVEALIFAIVYQQVIDPHQLVSFLFCIRYQLRQQVVKLVGSFAVGTNVGQQYKTVQPAGAALLIVEDGLQNGFGVSVIFCIRCSVVGMAQRAGTEVDQLQTCFFCPGGNGIVVPLVGWQKVRSVFFADAQLL